MNEYRDPVCGMTVDPEKSVKAEYNGQVYYFCSDSCKEKFEAMPGNYLE